MKKMVRALVVTPDKLQEYGFAHSSKNIANFIYQHRDARKIILTDAAGRFLLSYVDGSIKDDMNDDCVVKILDELLALMFDNVVPETVHTCVLERTNQPNCVLV